jgi:hypothetical protein
MLMLAGCGQFLKSASTAPVPQTPRQGIAYGTELVKTLAQGVAIAKTNGEITPAKRDELVKKLQDAQDKLKSADSLLVLYDAAKKTGTASENQSAAVQSALSAALSLLYSVQSDLAKVQPATKSGGG